MTETVDNAEQSDVATSERSNAPPSRPRRTSMSDDLRSAAIHAVSAALFAGVPIAVLAFFVDFRERGGPPIEDVLRRAVGAGLAVTLSMATARLLVLRVVGRTVVVAATAGVIATVTVFATTGWVIYVDILRAANPAGPALVEATEMTFSGRTTSMALITGLAIGALTWARAGRPDDQTLDDLFSEATRGALMGGVALLALTLATALIHGALAEPFDGPRWSARLASAGGSTFRLTVLAILFLVPLVLSVGPARAFDRVK